MGLYFLLFINVILLAVVVDVVTLIQRMVGVTRARSLMTMDVILLHYANEFLLFLPLRNRNESQSIEQQTKRMLSCLFECCNVFFMQRKNCKRFDVPVCV